MRNIKENQVAKIKYCFNSESNISALEVPAEHNGPGSAKLMNVTLWIFIMEVDVLELVPSDRFVNQNRQKTEIGEGAKGAESVENRVVFHVEQDKNGEAVKRNGIVQIPRRAKSPLLVSLGQIALGILGIVSV